MDTTTALKLITTRTDHALEAAASARARLTAALADHGAHLDSAMSAVLTAEAMAAPWSKLTRRIDRLGVREGLATLRKEATETLLGGGISLSTDLVTNAARHAEHEGLRRFLSATEHFEIEENPTPAEPAPATATNIPREEKNGLYVIRDTFVQRKGYKAREGWRYVTSVAGITLSTALGDLLIGRGWAEVDDTVDLLVGQAVRLTAAGRHILAD
ncbi:hypothetical protein ACH4Q7_22645 [Streptomyces roseolus]|uniref:hypothetical protein n=1 Tax=Streptomyces roseolus TaxID=67358 RepID=UPI0037BE177B